MLRTRWNLVPAVLGAIAMMTVSSPRAGAHPFTPDQTNDGVNSTVFQSVFLAPLGQEFTPTVGSLSVVELQTLDLDFANASGAELQVNVRAGTIDGAIAGTSQVVTLPPDFGVLTGDYLTHFDFSSPVSLVPGTVYVIEIVLVSGDNWGIGSSGTDTYPGGRQILFGEPQPDNDLWFREGPVTAIGVENASWSAVKSLYQR